MRNYISLEFPPVWTLMDENDPYLIATGTEALMQLDPGLCERAKKASEEFFKIQTELEVLYRAQEGLKLREGDIVPPFVKFTKGHKK